MTYQRFEDLPVWQTAAELYDHADDFLDTAPPRLRPSFRDQLERATLSVSNNIAEGFERGTTNELLSFIYIARGSAGEVRSILTVARRRRYLEDFKLQVSNLIALAESCSRQLKGWADSLQDSDVKGQRHWNQRTRAQEEQKQRALVMQKECLRRFPPGHPLRKDAEQRGLI